MRKRHKPLLAELNVGSTQLIVGMIIVLLTAAFMAPRLEDAYQHAQTVPCEKNLHDIGLALMGYCQDYDDVFPPGYSNVRNARDNYSAWPDLVGGYGVAPQRFRCPEDSALPDKNETLAGYRVSYSGNGYITPDGILHGVFADERLGPRTNMVPAVRSMSSITHPSETILVTERFDLRSMSEYQPANLRYVAGSVFTNLDRGADGHVPDGTRRVGALPGPNGDVTAPHSKKANFLFVDGHVSPNVPSATNPDPNALPLKNEWDAIRK